MDGHSWGVPALAGACPQRNSTLKQPKKREDWYGKKERGERPTVAQTCPWESGKQRWAGRACSPVSPALATLLPQGRQRKLWPGGWNSPMQSAAKRVYWKVLTDGVRQMGWHFYLLCANFSISLRAKYLVWFTAVWVQFYVPKQLNCFSSWKVTLQVYN